jgi:hypothetical protein
VTDHGDGVLALDSSGPVTNSVCVVPRRERVPQALALNGLLGNCTLHSKGLSTQIVNDKGRYRQQRAQLSAPEISVACDAA